MQRPHFRLRKKNWRGSKKGFFWNLLKADGHDWQILGVFTSQLQKQVTLRVFGLWRRLLARFVALTLNSHPKKFLHTPHPVWAPWRHTFQTDFTQKCFGHKWAHGHGRRNHWKFILFDCWRKVPNKLVNEMSWYRNIITLWFELSDCAAFLTFLAQ